MTYRVTIVGCGRMGGSIDDEVQAPLYRAWLPYSHAAAYSSLSDTALVAAADTDPEKLNTLTNRWQVPNRYTDYREMIEKEKPDIVSVTTPATSHAEISLFAAGHGVKGIYCEKAICCSMAEADRLADACRRNRVALNVGTQRRYHPGFEAMRRIIEQGEIGAPLSLIHRGGGSLMHTASHSFDTLLYLAGDPEVEFVQGQLNTPRYDTNANRFTGSTSWESDPGIHHAVIGFAGGVTGYIVRSPGSYDFEVVCEKGRISSLDNGAEWNLRVHRGNYIWENVEFPAVQGKSPTQRCIEDLIRAIESGGPGHLEIACRGMEMSIALALSHLEDGSRVRLPVANRTLYIPSH